MAHWAYDTSTEGTPAAFEWERPPPPSLPDPERAVRTSPEPQPTRRRWLTWLSRSVLVFAIALLAFGAFRFWEDGAAVAERQNVLEGSFERRLDLAASGLPLEALAAPAEEPVVDTTDPVSVEDDGDDPRMAVPSSVYASAEIAALEPEEAPGSGFLRELAPAKGEVLGRITIPAIELEWMIIEGVDLEFLESGPGHMAWTPVPGQPGNSVISGHRTTFGAPFHDLDLLEPGDWIRVETLSGTHIYEVYDSVVVPPDGVWVTHQWGGAWLTLTTCNPKGSAAERLVVFAEMVESPNLEGITTSTERTPPRKPEEA